MKSSIGSQAGLGARLGTGVDRRAVRMLARGGHWPLFSLFLLAAPDAVLLGGSGELTGRGGRSWSVHHRK